MKGLRKGVGTSLLLGALALTVSVAGCSSGGDTSTENATGTVSMQLTGQTGGNSYRLRNARFDLTGTTSTVLDSEADLSAVTLNATLPTGAYSINLEPGWSLERLDAGAFAAVDATLTSPNPKSFQILGGGTTNVAYQFSTNGTLVTIGTGQLTVSIGVIETGGGSGGGGGTPGACSLVPQSGCTGGLACYFAGASDGTGVCLSPGSVPVGGLCAAAPDCAAGGVCVQANGSNICLQMCNVITAPNVCVAGQTCFDAMVGGGLGVCN